MIGAASHARSRLGDPDTSRSAAAAVTPGLPAKQFAVLRFAYRADEAGFIDPEMQDHFEDFGSTHRSRRAELVDAGMISDTGRRRRRDGKGREFIVWAITPRGVAAYLKDAH